MASAALLKSRLDNIGEELDRKTRHCREHGDYVSVARMHLSSRPVWSGCPSCLQQKKQKEMDEMRSNQPNLTAKYTRAGIAKRYLKSTFDSYVPQNPSQKRAKEAVSRYFTSICSDSIDGKGLILCGDTEAGKTHLASALTRKLVDAGKTVKLICAIDMIREIRSSYKSDTVSEADIIKQFIDYDVLIIDEIGIQMGTTSELVSLFDVINGRYSDMKTVMAISNMDSEKLSDFVTPRVYRRIRNDGIVLEINTGGEK